MAGGRWCRCGSLGFSCIGPQWSPGLMAGGSRYSLHAYGIAIDVPQWSPGLMAGGRSGHAGAGPQRRLAAMEPRPDGRGKGSRANRG